MSKSDMDLTGIPGLPGARPLAPPVKRAATHKAVSTTSRSPRAVDGERRGLPPGNPYFHDKKVPLNRKVAEGIVIALQECSAALRSKGYKASDAELLQAVLHHGLPGNEAEAEALWQRWLLVKAAPPVENTT